MSGSPNVRLYRTYDGDVMSGSPMFDFTERMVVI
jgi:hypothetical protein